MNQCSKCGAVVEKFQRKSRRCQPCRNASMRDYCARTGYHKKRYVKASAKERERHLVRKYGVTQARYDQMFEDQKGCCAICRKSQKRAFDVDHCHKTNRVRGLLCTSCNRMIGHAGDDPATLTKAAAYLEAVPQVAAKVIKAFMECRPS